MPCPDVGALPNPATLYPIEGHKGTVLLAPLLDENPPQAVRMGLADAVEVGRFSYYGDFDDPLPFFDRNVRYHFGFSGARLRIGSFCAIAHGATFVMSEANHVIDGISSYPFPIMGGDWAEALSPADMPWPHKGDTVVGHDVWLGYESLIMPGVSIGNGAIVAARAVVGKDVPPYSIVAGNPARVVRQRFTDDEIALLQQLAWWDWPQNKITAAIPALVKNDLAVLRTLA